MLMHSLSSLTAPIKIQNLGTGVVWGTFYDIRRYGGLQIFFRAVLGRGSLVLSSGDESAANHLLRLGAHGGTHVSGTASQLASCANEPGSPRHSATLHSFIRRNRRSVAPGEVEMKIDNDSLRIRSARIAAGYVGEENGVLTDDERFVDTGNIVERRGDRYYFLGRRH